MIESDGDLFGFYCFSADLRLEVGLLRGSKDVSRGNVEVKENLTERRPISGLALPGINKKNQGEM